MQGPQKDRVIISDLLPYPLDPLVAGEWSMRLTSKQRLQ